MGFVKQDVHRPGVYKKSNKLHKTGRHRSKGSISNDSRGNVSVKKLSKHIKKELGKEARRNQLQQIRSNKRDEVLKKKRSLYGLQSPPILIAVVALQEDLNVDGIVNLLVSADENAIVKNSLCATHIGIPKFKQRFSIVVPPVGNIFATLDYVKVANIVLFVTSASNASDKSQDNNVLDSWGEEIIQSIISQGMPSPILVVTDTESLSIKKRHDYKQNVQKTMFKWLPEEKVMTLDKAADALNLLRRAGSQKQKDITYRNKRSYLLAEDVKFNLNNNESPNDFGILEVSGYLQGLPLSVNGLVHLSGFGDYQMSRIIESKDPFSLDLRKEDSQKNITEANVAVADPSKQESLMSENIPDPMDAEQTWPTEEELAMAKVNQTKKIVKFVPKGTSEYQAAWIPDEDGEEYNDDEEEFDDDRMTVDDAKSEENSDVEAEDKEEYETITISEVPNEQQYDENINLQEEKEAIIKFKEAKLDSEFPDEVDTPQDILARVRFQKYRGLKSFRTTFWDKKENLPYDYGRIFQFQNYDRTRRRIFKERENLLDVQPGSYVTVHINGISKELYEAYTSKFNHPLILCGILENEHKMSVLNLRLKRTINSKIPIKSKERLVFQCGFRKFTACPIFSEHTNGNKHKYERFFQPNTVIVATIYAPITFPPCPVLCYLKKSDGSLELIATGSLLSINPERLVIKRIILSGHPLKIHKRSAVIRFMFFDREDIRWFKPVKLRTKCGRKGHIKEPLGTHGHMKCIFDGQLKSQDTVLMNLYKRVYPKWNYEPILLTFNTNKAPPTVVKME
ncbi:PREDICTED: pre-rRNA-processing protein TSR1 homolog [Ceratosolen solmsi marchali]|uniref:Pre-rRNA-processing protein TSR1 homolog n=1 Tax=Ceratosolen solmsi marchali TaxID=326594 RepID=A0AAJ6VK13_9HYME|nr:PREDICTED: pre-rRNA-processing protein TSR1 homolog [Ceratosolen solmsi marchali]